jgi:hypothetical protein
VRIVSLPLRVPASTHVDTPPAFGQWNNPVRAFLLDEKAPDHCQHDAGRVKAVAGAKSARARLRRALADWLIFRDDCAVH